MTSIVVDGIAVKFPDDTFRCTDSTFAFESWKETLLTVVDCGEVNVIIFDEFVLFDRRTPVCDITAKLEPRSGGRGASLLPFWVAIKSYINIKPIIH